MHRVFFILFLPQVVWANCSYEKTMNIAFSSEDATDVITSRVVAGDDCSKGFEHITIKKTNGWWLYEYYAPLSHYFRNQPVTTDDVKRIVESNLSERYFSNTSLLPKWQESEGYYESNYQEISVSKEQYQLYLSKKWPTYSHQVGYEGSKVIVYDRDSDRVVEVSSGSP